MLTNREQALPPGTLIDGFEIRRVIGTGGFGVTYLGFDTSLERPVAIKEYCPQGIAQRSPGDTTLIPGEPELEEQYTYGLTRFLDEARVLARFHHPSIVHVHRFLEANGTGYLIMDMEQGQTLWRVLRGSKTLDEESILGVLVPVLEGLEVVHSQNYMHRDIKPPNIFLRDKGAPVLLDFGSARQALEQQGNQLTVLVTGPPKAPDEEREKIIEARLKTADGAHFVLEHEGAFEDGADLLYLVTTSSRPLEDATRIAYRELVRWMAAEYGYDQWDAYMMLSQCGKVRLGNFVDPKYTIGAAVPKKYLA